MSQEFWKDRGNPWEYDPGPALNRSWARLFSETPNYRGLGKAVAGREKFRWHFGPMYYRGRLQDNAVKVVVIGQEGAQDESLAHRSFTGGTGARMQHLLNHIGINRSYLFLNTFVYPIFGQYGSDELKWLAQDPESPIVKHRHEIFDYILARNDVRLVIAVGTAAKDSVVTWIRNEGGTCPLGARDVSRCTGGVLDPKTKLIGVLHPGGAAFGGGGAVKADFQRAIRKIATWAGQDPSWLPVDPGAVRRSADDYAYRSAPIPFRDFPYGVTWRLGRGGTSSNRKDSQRSIQLFSKGGKYNNRGDSISYSSSATGSDEGYADGPGDVPYEPPVDRYRDFDRGPGSRFARLFMGGDPGFEWPDFEALGVRAHPSLGYGPIYRGRPRNAKLLVLADQQSHDDLFTGRALTGDAGQHLQAFLEAMGITRSYVIIRVLPVDTRDLTTAKVRSIVNHQQVRAVYAEIVSEIVSASSNLKVLLTVGPQAETLLPHVDPGGLQTLSMKAWRQSGALADWRSTLNLLKTRTYAKDLSNPTFNYDGARAQIPRIDLPYGTLRWQGSSGDRAVRATQSGKPSPNYYKLFMPNWAFRLAPEPLTTAERNAADNAP